MAVVHYGERNGVLAAALQAQGASVEELCLYEWLLPDDLGPLQALIAVDFDNIRNVRTCFRCIQTTATSARAPAAHVLGSGTMVATVIWSMP